MEAEKRLRLVARLGWAIVCVLVALSSSPGYASYPVTVQAEVSAVLEGSSDQLLAQSNHSQVAVTDEAVLHPGWNLISLPYRPADPNPVKVFDGIDVFNLWRYDPQSLSLVQYDGFEFGNVGFTTCSPGEAYWLSAVGGERLTIADGAPITSPYTLQFAARAMAMIGNPHLDPLSLLDCGVLTYQEEWWQAWSFRDLLTAGYVADPLQWYDPVSQSYVDSNIATEPLYPWRGYRFQTLTPAEQCWLVVPKPASL